MQIKVTVIYHFIPTSLAKPRKTCFCGYSEERVFSCTVAGDVASYGLLGEHVTMSVRINIRINIRIRVCLWSSIPGIPFMEVKTPANSSARAWVSITAMANATKSAQTVTRRGSCTTPGWLGRVCPPYCGGRTAAGGQGASGEKDSRAFACV